MPRYPGNGVIYAIGVNGEPLVKIGMSRVSAEHRLRQIQNFSPFPLQVFADVAVDKNICQVERTLHELLAPQRQKGEWFLLNVSQEELERLVCLAQQTLEQAFLRKVQAQTLLPPPTPRQIDRARRMLESRERARQRNEGRTSAPSPQPALALAPTPSPPPPYLEDLNLVSLGEHVRIQRKMVNISQKELARRSGVSHMTIMQIEQGRSKGMKLATLLKLSEALEVTIRYHWKSPL
jgi:DNA-binding XRE family transcriptional regulator